MRFSSSADLVEFQLQLLDGRVVDVHAAGKVVARDYWTPVEVSELYCGVYSYLHDPDGVELVMQDIPNDWNRIHDAAIEKLIEQYQEAIRERDAG